MTKLILLFVTLSSFATIHFVWQNEFYILYHAYFDSLFPSLQSFGIWHFPQNQLKCMSKSNVTNHLSATFLQLQLQLQAPAVWASGRATAAVTAWPTGRVWVLALVQSRRCPPATAWSRRAAIRRLPATASTSWCFIGKYIQNKKRWCEAHEYEALPSVLRSGRRGPSSGVEPTRPHYLLLYI